MSELWAGWSKRELIVPVGHRMAGYLARKEPSSGRLSPLFVRALVLRQGRLEAALVLADLLAISSSWAKLLRSRLSNTLGIPPEHIIVAATHTHSGPQIDTAPFDFSGGTVETRFERSLMSSISCSMADALKEARRSLVPVRVETASIRIRGVASDRNHARRSRTQRLVLIRFQGKIGAGVLGVFGCHPTVLGAQNTLLSGDLPAATTSLLESDSTTVLLATGAAANISTRFTRHAQTPRELRVLAARVAKQARRARFRALPSPDMAVHSDVVRLPVADLGRLPASKRRSGRLAGRCAIVRTEALEVRERLAKAAEFTHGFIEAPLTLLRIGHTSLVALPFEIYSDTGEFLWKRARIAALCYANGYWGYVPSPSAGREDYEALSSPFNSVADARLRRAILSLNEAGA